jgi:hypothetical protein
MDKCLREVVEAARDKTRRGGQDWEPFGEETFRARVGTGTITVLKVAEPDDAPQDAPRTYLVSVYDRMGRTAATAEVGPSDAAGDYRAVEGLYDAAQESVLRPKRVLDEMLQVLRR